SAKFGNSTISTDITVDFSLQDNPGNVSQADMSKLIAGGAADSKFGFLYPYDKTVFPRGLPPPSLQLAGTAASATYLKLSAPHFLYERFEGASTPTRVTIPPDVWNGVTRSAGATDWASASVTKLTLGAASGPATERWLIGQAKLKGIVYYN